MSIRDDRLPGLVQSFMRAAVEPDLWREVLNSAADVLRSEGIALAGMPDGRSGVACSEGLDELVDRFVREQWYLRNPRLDYAMRKGMNASSIATDWLVFTDDELRRLDFNGDFIAGLGLGPYAGAILAQRDGNVVLFSAERTPKQGRFSNTEVDLLKRILPWMQVATRLSLRVGEARVAGLVEGLDLLRTPAMLLDFGGRPVRANGGAEALVGNGLVLRQGQIRASHPGSDRELQSAIGAALLSAAGLSGPPPDRVALRRPNARPLLVEVTPLPATAMFVRVKVMLSFADPDTTGVTDVGSLRAVFGLTASEASLAASIADGEDIPTAARRRGITPTTARSYLKAIFAKTGTHRQAELAALLSKFRRPGP